MKSPSTDEASRRDRFGLAILVSGNGSNLQAVIDACATGRLAAEVKVVISNNPDAYALTRAERAGMPTIVVEPDGRARRDYDEDLARIVATVGIDLVVMAGWDRLLTEVFVGHHPVINLHPAKPGAFPGLGAIERAFEAWRDGRITSGGVMVHFVPDEGVDNGPVIVAEEVAFDPDDTLAHFTERVHAVEHRLLVEAIDRVITLSAGGALR